MRSLGLFAFSVWGRKPRTGDSEILFTTTHPNQKLKILKIRNPPFSPAESAEIAKNPQTNANRKKLRTRNLETGDSQHTQSEIGNLRLNISM